MPRDRTRKALIIGIVLLTVLSLAVSPVSANEDLDSGDGGGDSDSPSAGGHPTEDSATYSGPIFGTDIGGSAYGGLRT